MRPTKEAKFGNFQLLAADRCRDSSVGNGFYGWSEVKKEHPGLKA